MVPDATERGTEPAQFCAFYGVARLDWFGNAATSAHWTDENGLSFLVEFQILPPGT